MQRQSQYAVIIASMPKMCMKQHAVHLKVKINSLKRKCLFHFLFVFFHVLENK